MERRDVLKGMTLAAGAVVAAKEVLTPTPAEAQVSGGRPEGNAALGITPVDADYFIPGRFAGKTFIVTGSARGMGAAAAIRLAREGANVIGVDWIKDLGEATHQAILAAGGTITQETRHWHEDTGVTSPGRPKSDADDYLYFPEPDLLPV